MAREHRYTGRIYIYICAIYLEPETQDEALAGNILCDARGFELKPAGPARSAPVAVAARARALGEMIMKHMQRDDTIEATARTINSSIRISHSHSHYTL